MSTQPEPDSTTPRHTVRHPHTQRRDNARVADDQSSELEFPCAQTVDALLVGGIPAGGLWTGGGTPVTLVGRPRGQGHDGPGLPLEQGLQFASHLIRLSLGIDEVVWEGVRLLVVLLCQAVTVLPFEWLAAPTGAPRDRLAPGGPAYPA